MSSVITYSEMIKLDTFEERFEYLKLGGVVGRETFGSRRVNNQRFYKSREWRQLRNHIIVRDGGFDLAFPERYISGHTLIHHIVPIDDDDIRHGSDNLFDPENLVCVSHDTHNAIHYGDFSLVKQDFVERSPNDTNLW